MADAAERCGLPLEPMPQATQERLLQRLPFSSPRNPVDITAQVFNDMGVLEENLQAMLEENPALAASFFHYLTHLMAERLSNTNETLQALLE